MQKLIQIGAAQVPMKASGNTPKIYRNMFSRDMIIEMKELFKSLDNDGQISEETDLSIVENVAYVMAYEANPGIGTMTEWLDTLGPFDIFNAMPDILHVWTGSSNTLSDSKKN